MRAVDGPPPPELGAARREDMTPRRQNPMAPKTDLVARGGEKFSAAKGRRGAGGRNRTGTGLAALRIFVPATAFAAPRMRVWGLDYPFALAPSRLRRRPSSLYTFPPKRRAWLGIATCEVSPTLSGSTPAVSRLEHSNCFKSVASTSFATPARTRRASYRAQAAGAPSSDFDASSQRRIFWRKSSALRMGA